jgi:hypothetical protein
MTTKEKLELMYKLLALEPTKRHSIIEWVKKQGMYNVNDWSLTEWILLDEVVKDIKKE